MPDLIGQTLGGYRVLSQVGKGGMATVYKAFQPSLERYVAIKVLPPYYAEQDETFLKRFRLEAHSIARLRHPNILTIHEYGEEKGTTFIVMEYVEAGTLSDRLGRPLPLPEVEPLLRQVASALQYAHEQGVVHRDVKPSNILLPKPDWPLLTDFGLARIVGGSHLTQTGSIAGTPAYMSPEQGRGESPDHRTDIYSLGIVLYEMVTGAVPFTAETPMAVIVKHIIDPLPLPRTINPDLPEKVEAVILKALAKNREDRYARAGDVADAFTRSLSAVPVAGSAGLGQSTTLTSVASPAGASRRKLLPAALIAVLACALLAGTAFALRRLRSARGQDSLATPATQSASVATPQATRTFDQLMADGQAHLAQGDVESAVVDYQEAIGADPANLDLYWQISDLLLEYGYTDHAKAFADAAAAAGPDEAWFHESAGWHYSGLGAHSEAASHFQRALELDPESLWSYIGLADSLQGLDDPDASRLPLDALAAHDPVADPDLYENLGWNYFELYAYVEAQAAFRQAITQDETKTGAWSGLIYATYNLEGAGAAMDPAQEALAANPDDPSLHELVGNLAWELGDVAGAEDEFLNSTQLDPTYSSGYISLARLYEEEGRIDEAYAALQLGIENNPQDPWLHEAMGKTLLGQGDAESAFQHFTAASDLEPTYGWFPLQAAQAYYEYSGDAAGAAAFLERAAAAQPDDADLLDSVGQQYEAMGQCASASAYYTRALEINPDLENSQAGLTRCGGSG